MSNPPVQHETAHNGRMFALVDHSTASREPDHNAVASDLPPPNTKRWVIRRKAQVVSGVRNGIISLEEACRRYKLSMEEFLSWQRLIESHGLAGLRATRLQEYRTDKSE
jgi:Protein of unknown function (DUF1153)